MKQNGFLALCFSGFFLFSSFNLDSDFNYRESSEVTKAERISFRIQGTGSKGIFVEIGIGSKPGSGSCCSGVSAFTTASFTGEIGDVVYDGKTNRIITKIYKELEGETIRLYDYY